MCISTASRLALSVRRGVLKLLACCVFMVNSGEILSKWSLHEDLAGAMS